MLGVQEARELLADFHMAFPSQQGPRVRRVLHPSGPPLLLTGGSAPWEARLREEFLSRYGTPPLPLPASLETSPLVMALRLSPRFMGPGIRDAAHELLSSPVFLSSVALSVLVYFSAWLLPEPLFSKAFVTTLTLRLSLLVGALELGRVARTCVRLYQEAQAARSLPELEAAAQHFGESLGGTGLRVLVAVASMGISKLLPPVPKGGLGALLTRLRFSLPGGLSLSQVTSVQMVADGSIVVAGAALGTAAAAAGSACSDGSQKKDGHQWHHLATNKNATSTSQGGPWTPLFAKLFATADLDMDTPENLVYLSGHQGPHPEAYHKRVYTILQKAVQRCKETAQCRNKLLEALREIASEVCTSGSRLHQLLTNSQE